MITNSNSKEKLPAYITEIYGDLYQNEKKCAQRDSLFWCKLKNLFQYKKLIKAVLGELRSGQQVLQLGVTFGNQIDEVASFIGAYGTYDVIDINPLQSARAKEKYEHIYRCLNFFNQDATTLKGNGSYDAVICFMLLSEVPPTTKTKIVNAALKQVRNGGKVIFIDWHNPLIYHPLRYITKTINRLRNPFVEKLWDRQIDTYASIRLKNQFLWRKSTYFGRMFQKMVAVKKQSPIETNEPKKNKN